MAAWSGQPNTVNLAWTANLKRGYYINHKIGSEFGPTYAEKSAALVNSYVIVKGNSKCPGGSGPNKIIRIPGTLQYHAYPGNSFGTLKGGKLLQPGRTWQQCGVGRGLWYITATFTPTKCWRNFGIRVTRIITPTIWICRACSNPWPIPCPCL